MSMSTQLFNAYPVYRVKMTEATVVPCKLQVSREGKTVTVPQNAEIHETKDRIQGHRGIQNLVYLMGDEACNCLKHCIGGPTKKKQTYVHPNDLFAYLPHLKHFEACVVTNGRKYRNPTKPLKLAMYLTHVTLDAASLEYDICPPPENKAFRTRTLCLTQPLDQNYTSYQHLVNMLHAHCQTSISSLLLRVRVPYTSGRRQICALLGVTMPVSTELDVMEPYSKNKNPEDVSLGTEVAVYLGFLRDMMPEAKKEAFSRLRMQPCLSRFMATYLQASTLSLRHESATIAMLALWSETIKTDDDWMKVSGAGKNLATVALRLPIHNHDVITRGLSVLLLSWLLRTSVREEDTSLRLYVQMQPGFHEGKGLESFFRAFKSVETLEFTHSLTVTLCVENAADRDRLLNDVTCREMCEDLSLMAVWKIAVDKDLCTPLGRLQTELVPPLKHMEDNNVVVTDDDTLAQMLNEVMNE